MDSTKFPFHFFSSNQPLLAGCGCVLQKLLYFCYSKCCAWHQRLSVHIDRVQIFELFSFFLWLEPVICSKLIQKHMHRCRFARHPQNRDAIWHLNTEVFLWLMKVFVLWDGMGALQGYNAWIHWAQNVKRMVQGAWDTIFTHGLATESRPSPHRESADFFVEVHLIDKNMFWKKQHFSCNQNYKDCDKIMTILYLYVWF